MTDNLALRMRPTSIDQIIGQEHLVGQGKIIRRMVEANRLTSMILYGPPGIGKTSIASAIAGTTKYAFRTFNATVDSKKRLQEIAEEAKFSGGLVLLLDEIHRLDKTKQDFLLPLLEQGLITMIGATTENPFFSVTPAIRSRVQIFELEPLTTDDIKQAIELALNDKERGYDFPVQIDSQALTFIAVATNGDLRSAYNSLDLAVLSTPPETDGSHHITLEIMENSLQRSYITMDKDGDGHYDTLSALQKSIRGSDVNASLHYAARLIAAGDLASLARRLTVIAYEDIGLANPDAQIHTVTALEAAQKIGFPEARILIANVVIDLALSPKSNSAYLAIDKALADLKQTGNLPIPRHLRDGHYAGSKELGNAQDYLYPHNFPEKWVKQDYLPDKLRNVSYFSPNHTGKYERALALNKERIDQLTKKDESPIKNKD
ncbi:replication-associated recombination protein A [Streptococcus cuniculipharyngis]|uniref:Replication-associated recombination protein A n=1 Tax=Streptococcus cuniculipharyngis TaxID=1562651 RepID=A0A5C5SBC2_9STRE|nr:replication-associated recombination protein A [Streptococcus cuniculipharyngis]TWS97665.1 replication-associated recombination protein A [Streptococcus cuniculipharyngis]